MTEFQYVGYAQEIIFRPGALESLDESCKRFGLDRVMLCTSGSARRNGTIERVQAILGRRLVVIFDCVQQHVQDLQVAQALELGEQQQVDAVVGLGGGSPIGMAKAVSLALEEKRKGHSPRARFPTDQPLIPVIAIPTTYAGSEMTPVYGITQHSDGTARKVTVNDPKITPKLVIYDPLLTLDIPPELTASSGINALAHCVEAVYSITRNPVSSAAALEGAKHIYHSLPRCFDAGSDVDARTELQLGAHLAGFALASVAMGLHHGLCHVLGGTAGVPHGIANAIILPHAIRFNADVCARELAQIAAAIGISREGRDGAGMASDAAGAVYAMVAQMKLPQHLREADVKEDDLPRLAGLAAASRTVQNNPKPIDAAQVEAILRAAW
jgi:maleylacetate reductase